ncbi:hypothetical protein [Chamaesiphon sp. GL140_3_metabinner_50]|uniref:hypothetical protein n=1 Tax=Chamaesiphon sp. GL140_3_metabinner_50 TaxID=2970812 RepID=UPI0025F9F912|nr:hypothetical protein [Chamaesiphon sp. GL140_3_metabinner_50]
MLFIACSIILRFAWNLAILIHGFGHVLLTSIVDRDPASIDTSNILEHRNISDIFRSLIPAHPIFIPLVRDDVLWVAAGKTTPIAIRIKAVGGILFNVIAVKLVSIALPFANYLSVDRSSDEFIIQFVINASIGANLVAIFSSLSDFSAAFTGEATCFNCGNFGFVGKRLANDGAALLPPRVVEIFHKMGGETEIRGEQAGGGLVFARDARADRVVFVGKKVLNQKRRNLTQSLESVFELVRQQAIQSGAKAVDKAIVGVWHYRYATSSPPAILETHWHEWMPARTADVWRVEDGKWLCDRQTVNHRITHNGDFDAWMLFGEAIENAELGLWLERVLHTPNSTLGDSPKIAGMMDLLITQGMWDAALRLAYQLEVVKSIEEAFGGKNPSQDAPNTAPSELEIQEWTAIVERVFCQHQAAILRPRASSMLELSAGQIELFERDLILALCQHRSIARWTVAERAAFVKTAVYVFFHNNIYQATKVFMSRATGSFGLVTASTLNEASLVLSAWGQPISTGFNVSDDYMVYASEPAAVDAVLADIPRSYRLDLDQKTGEIAWVSVNRITIYSMAADRELRGAELEQRWIPLQGNPYILPPSKSAKDPVAHDISEIPQVLAAIAESWRDRDSFNRQSANYLAELLIEKAKNWDRRQQATIDIKLDRAPPDRSVDLLITGVENSLWIGERFAQDLAILCPGLRIETRSANQVLRKLQYDPNALHLGSTSIVLAISQSGQTFPTLQATHIFEQLRREAAIGELFLMTGEICSLMGTAISQYYYPQSTFSRRIFINGSGRRTAEPSTVAAAAAQATLTELLIYLAKRLQKRFPGRDGALGMTLTSTDLVTLDRIKKDFIDRSVIPIVGTTVNGDSINSPTHRQLIHNSSKWAFHVTETPTAWAIHALYIIISVGFQAPLVQTLVRSIFGLANLSLPGWLLPAIVLADIAIYIFGSWFWTLGLRYFQGRPLLARTGKRTLIIGDVPWVHQLLKVYVSKLFSLSYGIASLDVHGANPQDHMLHHFGHRVVRGTLVFLGIPDGRTDRLQKDNENAAIMTGKQASGVRNFQTGADIIALGHNPTIFVPKGSANAKRGFEAAIILPGDAISTSDSTTLAELREARFGSFDRLLASYVFFWWLSKKVASFPLLGYQHWKSQSRTRTMTTAAPVSRAMPSETSSSASELPQHVLKK